MKIYNIEINNFRSIKEAIIDFKENPRVLVGINDSGKTNVLQSLRLLSEEYSINDDIRKTTEDYISEYNIKFIFKLENDDIQEIINLLKVEIFIKNIQKKILIIEDKEFSLIEFFNNNNEIIYNVDLKNKTRNIFFNISKKINLFCDFRKPKPGSNYNINYKNQVQLNISSFKIIDYDDFKEDIPEEYLEKINISYFKETIESKIQEFFKKNIPKVIYWKYSEENLLPSSINIDNFQNNPSYCKPLKNLFIIGGIPEEKISEYIQEKRNNFNDFQSSLEKIATESTIFFREAWPEYKDIKFNLHLTETTIRCGLKEKNIHDFSRKSDGFKKFISLLLILSIPSVKKILKNSLILIDDADTNLHPSGSKYLLEQLKKIAEVNYVIYATHSIFMIDTNNIERHYVVKKENEITSIKEADEENYRDEEVLYKALNTSVYEVLNEKNIIFEGWTDKKIFETFISRHKKFKKFFKKIGITHGGGVKDKELSGMSMILEMARRKLLIISDGDNVAIDKQKNFQERKLYGEWKRYDEIYREKEPKTVEDFIKKEFIIQTFNTLLKEFNIPIIKDLEFGDSERIFKIKNLVQNVLNDESKVGEFIKKFKTQLFENFKYEYIESYYKNFVEKLMEEIEKL